MVKAWVAVGIAAVLAVAATLLTLTFTRWLPDEDGDAFWLGDPTPRCPWADDSKVLSAGAAQYATEYVFVLSAPTSEQDLKEIDSILLGISDPDSENYGLREDAVSRAADIVGIDVASLDRFVSFLADEYDAFNVRASPFRDSVVAALPTLEYMRSVDKIAAKSGVTIYAALAYDNLYGETSLDFMKEANPSLSVGAQEVVDVPGLLETIRELEMLSLDDIKVSMNMEEAPAPIARGRNMVVMPTSTPFTPKNLQTYWAYMNVTSANITDLKFWGSGAGPVADSTNYDIEADMDLQLLTGIAPGIETVLTNVANSYYAFTQSKDSWGTFSPDEVPLMAILYSTNALPEECLPTVMSASFNFVTGDYVDRLRAEIEAQQAGSADPISLEFLSDIFGDVGSPSAERILNTQLALLGMRGITFVSSTGDGGSHYLHDPTDPYIRGLLRRGPDISLSGSQVQAINSAMAVLQMPLYPAESPYVLGVGGIMKGPAGLNDPVYWNSEVTVEGITSNNAGGAGFSFTQPRPGYQEQTVREYVANYVEPPSSFEFIFNSSGRAYADVSAWAWQLAIVDGSSFSSEGGTSASAPIVAGLISQLNHHRMTAGLPSLGFVNPWLYQLNGTGFLDITSGNSRTYDSLRGFNATPGWDVVTGWGLPSYRDLVVELGS